MRLNDHQPVPVENPIIMTAAQFNDLQDFLADLVEKNQQPAKTLSDEQFAELQKLLQPGYELSTLMLNDYKAQRMAAQTTTRDVIANAAVIPEWRTPEEIAAGVPLDAADKETIIANRVPLEPSDWRTEQEVQAGVPIDAPNREEIIAARSA